MTIDRLLAIMARLRDPVRGCPWDLEQDFASIAPYTIEEAYEVADAIARGSTAELKDELGDLLLQVVFHAQIAADRGLFRFDDVVAAICDKMVRRHPHVFGGEQVRDAGEQTRRWEELKRAERAAHGRGTGALDSVPVALPALTRARKLGRRAAEAGMDWPDSAGPRAKIDEELRELDEACAGGDPRRMSDELGDLLFAVVNFARHHDIDPEQSLAAAGRRFATRFAHVERALDEAGTDLRRAAPELLDRLWDEAKRAGSSSSEGFSGGSESGA
ncbi:MAG: nucleoside triphosphate pyrophosphohydrolase [Steroidobacteraceae bacterium]